jgi:hypothetical protein
MSALRQSKWDAAPRLCGRAAISMASFCTERCCAAGELPQAAKTRAVTHTANPKINFSKNPPEFLLGHHA